MRTQQLSFTLNIETSGSSKEGIGERAGSCLLAVKEKAKMLCVDSSAVWCHTVVSVGSIRLASEWRRGLAHVSLEMCGVSSGTPAWMLLPQRLKLCPSSSFWW